MRVTNEQARAKVICDTSGEDCPTACPFYQSDKCYELPGGKALADDLLEARELIKEMRNLIYGAASYNVDCSCQACQNVKVGIREMLVKTKEYA